jgi:hypothetical protein
VTAIITDVQLKNLENDCVKALYSLILNSDADITSANYLNDDKATITLEFGHLETIVIEVTAKRIEKE